MDLAERLAMLRSITLFTVTAFASGGCVPKTRTGATAATIGGAAIAVAGAAMLLSLKSPGDDTDGNGVDDYPENEIACAIGGCAIATAALLSGLTMAVFGVVSLNDLAEPPPEPTPLSGPTAAAMPIDVRLVAPLPEMPCDRQTLQLAKQARSAARQGDCDTARVVRQRISDRDPAYAEALAASPALARCR